ncbi:MAG: adenine deaminase [Alphaproteobacteria bacterium]
MPHTEHIAQRIDQALGREPADLVIRNTRFLNVASGTIDRGDIAICGERIVGTHEEYRGKVEIDGKDLVVSPGFIDSHVHVESTLVTPDQFDRCVLPRGTTTAICDPHEICNVLGRQGLEYFLEASAKLTLDLHIQLSSCVPSTDLETAGARLSAADLTPYRDHPAVIGLAEFMNFPGIFAKDPEVLEKLGAFEGAHIDGHCPLVSGYDLNAYCAVGVRNCHESTSLTEAREKLSKGMQVLIREGSVSKDLAALSPLLDPANSPFVTFCTDDRNPLDIAEEGHLDHLIRGAIASGTPPIIAYRAATWSAAQGFGLRDRGLVAPGYRADLVLLSDIESCAVHSVIKSGKPVTDRSFAAQTDMPPPVGRNSIKLDPIADDILRVPTNGPTGPVIGLIPDQIITEHLTLTLPYRNGERRPDPAQDVAKICILARHGVNNNVGRGFVRGFGLAGGALASSVGHDSHNICVVGMADGDMVLAVNRLIELGGGFVAARDGVIIAELALPIAGLMSDRSFTQVQQDLIGLRQAVKGLGCPLAEPFLQLAFLPLPVIPHLKITDLGLVDVDNFQLIAA